MLDALATGWSRVEQLTCIWLLTPPSNNNDGNRHFEPRAVHADLGTFLRDCVANGRRDVREIGQYFADRPFRYFSFGDDASSYLTAQSRQTYFESIPEFALRRSVVFFDPDNGLEPARVTTTAHLRYNELRGVFQRMDRNCLAVVYQHLPRRPGSLFWPEVADRLRVKLSCAIGYIAGGDVALFIALRDPGSAPEVGRILYEFQGEWPEPLRIAPLS